MKIRCGAQVLGGWLFDIQPVWWVRVRFRIREADMVGPGPTLIINIPWYYGTKILQMYLRLDVLFFHWIVEWNVQAV
ncbi:hypothetical protein ES703_62085 [subsurface metagenome]